MPGCMTLVRASLSDYIRHNTTLDRSRQDVFLYTNSTPVTVKDIGSVHGDLSLCSPIPCPLSGSLLSRVMGFAVPSGVSDRDLSNNWRSLYVFI